MSEEVKFLRPTQELIEAVAVDMRQEDADEVWASNHHTPLEALTEGVSLSDYSLVVTVNDKPCVVMGLVKRDILSGAGIPWLLGTNESLKYKRQFFEQVPAIINEMLSICPRLYNYVHAENKTSIKWLKWIGFTIEEPVPFGCDGSLFHKFYLERI